MPTPRLLAASVRKPEDLETYATARSLAWRADAPCYQRTDGMHYGPAGHLPEPPDGEVWVLPMVPCLCCLSSARLDAFLPAQDAAA